MNRTRTMLLAAVVALAGAALPAGEPPSFPIEGHVIDAAIARAPDGTYYLTGTTKVNMLDQKFSDFQNNDGVRLWKSKDLKTWEQVGLVWDLSKTGGRDAKKGGWQAHLRSVPGEPDKPWSRGVTAPELHFIKGAWWIVFALNDQDIGLLKSSSGKPEGPYEEIGRMSNRFLGGDGSLFEDSDGKVYLVWGGGYIAPMKEDMSDIAGEPTSLQMAIAGYPHTMPLSNQQGERGAFLFRDGGKYFLVYSAWNLRDGKGSYDTVICEASALLGPYAAPRVLVAGAQRQAMLFAGPADGVHMTYIKDGRLAIEPIKGK